MSLSAQSRFRTALACGALCLLLLGMVCIVPMPPWLMEHERLSKDPRLLSDSLPDKFCMRTTSYEADVCHLSLVESIPDGLIFNSSSTVVLESTYSAWKRLLAATSSSLSIASFYWTMRGVDVVEDPAAAQGEDVFARIMQLGLRPDVSVRIVQSWPDSYPPNDTELLLRRGAALVRSLNMARLLNSSGILHTKLWLCDVGNFYLGSANMDYRALTQVKELGVLGWGCDRLAADLAKVFTVYWDLAQSNHTAVPSVWPEHLHTTINYTHQLPLRLSSGQEVSVYVASSPPPLCPPGRSVDLDAILFTIAEARRFVYVSVMDYLPLVVTYGKSSASQPGLARSSYWPVIDDALRRAAVDNGVHVRLLISWWEHTRPELVNGLRSLAALNDMWGSVRLEVRLFRVPPASGSSKKIPFTRVNHCKYMVTERVMYVGTSNWSGDYFIDTGGVGLVVNETRSTLFADGRDSSPRAQLEAVFLRDWNSEHSQPLSDLS